MLRNTVHSIETDMVYGRRFRKPSNKRIRVPIGRNNPKPQQGSKNSIVLTRSGWEREGAAVFMLCTSPYCQK